MQQARRGVNSPFRKTFPTLRAISYSRGVTPPESGPSKATRNRLLQATLSVTCLLTMLASMPLWLGSRLFPQLPVSASFPGLTAPWDAIAFAVVLGSLLASIWLPRAGTGVFLIGSLFLALADQCRLQPWFYMYWVMLLLTLAKGEAALTACRIALSAVYVWGGAQKLTPEFFNLVAPWFVKPAAAWFPESLVTALKWGVFTAPFVEMFIGIGLWFRRARMPAIIATILVHVIAVLFLGPLGHRHNWIVWPWNLVMPVLVLVLFPRDATRHTWSSLRGSAWSSGVVALFCLLPVLSFFGKWDSYLSFSLYTGRLTKADIFISASLRERLPPALHEFIVATPTPFNEQLQGPYVVLTELWADKILRTPPLPEARNYRNVARYLASFASDPNDLRMVLIPRVGKPLFYRGGDLRPEAGIPLDL